MKTAAKPIRLRQALILFFLSGCVVFMPGTVGAQVFKSGDRSMYSSFVFNAADTLSRDTLTLVLKDKSVLFQVDSIPDEFIDLIHPIDSINFGLKIPIDSIRLTIGLRDSTFIVNPEDSINFGLNIPIDSVFRKKPTPPTTPAPTTYAIGAIPVQTEVSATGATIYHVPVDIVAGLNGFQPNVSIVYNSMGGNGVLGVGWGIGGLSVISRTNSNIYYDKSTKAPTFSDNDAFTLDGMRLIKTTSSAGITTYLPEQANSNMKVFKYAKHFEVYYPDGKIAIFGDPANTSTSILSYPIAKLTDNYGNSITCDYTFRNGHYYILIV
jgi:hypothetical protein